MLSRDLDRVTQFLHQYIDASKMELTFAVQTGTDLSSDAEDRLLEVHFSGPDVSRLLDRRAELLNSLEHLAAKLLELPPEEHHRIRFDAASYKSGRDEELQALVRQAIGEVTSSGHPFRLPPMNSRERRMVHLLIADADLRSVSSGEGPFRSVTVHPSETAAAPKPAAEAAETAARLARLRKSFGRK